MLVSRKAPPLPATRSAHSKAELRKYNNVVSIRSSGAEQWRTVDRSARALSNRKDRPIKLLAPKAPSLRQTSRLDSNARTRAPLIQWHGESTSEECALFARVSAEQQEGPDHQAARAESSITAPDEQRSQRRTHAWLLTTPHDGMGESTSEEWALSVRSERGLSDERAIMLVSPKAPNLPATSNTLRVAHNCTSICDDGRRYCML